MSRPRLVNDCFIADAPRLRHADAVRLLSSRITPIAGREVVPIASASGRVLAEAAVARHPVPAHTNAAVDGFAFAAGTFRGDGPESLTIAGRAAAGHPFEGSCPPGSAIEIFTGAVIPDGTDTVVMQEDVGRDRAFPDTVLVPPGLQRGANVRKSGEDVAAGVALYTVGDVLRPQDVAALASIGSDRVTVFERLRIAVVSTGDEVVRPGQRALGRGEVFDANAPMLAALAALAGGEVTDLGVWPDDRLEVGRRLREAAQSFDVILTSGGASRGAEDHMAASLDELGQRHLWQLAVKPGRPMMFGQIASPGRETVMVGLPGNPVAVFVCFLMYVYPMLRRLGGAPWREPRRFLLPAAFDFMGRKTGRREFWRGTLEETRQGLAAGKFARDGSGLITGLRVSDGLIDIPEDAGDIRRGDLVAFIPYTEFGIVRG